MAGNDTGSVDCAGTVQERGEAMKCPYCGKRTSDMPIHLKQNQGCHKKHIECLKAQWVDTVRAALGCGRPALDSVCARRVSWTDSGRCVGESREVVAE